MFDCAAVDINVYTGRQASEGGHSWCEKGTVWLKSCGDESEISNEMDGR